MDAPDQNSIATDFSLTSLQSYPQPNHLQSNNYCIPFHLILGETVVHCGHSVDGIIVLTKYRLYLQIGLQQHHIPLGLIEIIEHRELFFLQIGCKDARTYRCTFENNDICLEWYNRILKAVDPPKQLIQMFAFIRFSAYEESKHKFNEQPIPHGHYIFDKKMFNQEMNRLCFDGHSWRISQVNISYKLCPTYPPLLLVPSCITDETLESVAKFRSSKRIPAVVWRHVRNGAVIARCSQPEVGWLGWRSGADEDLIKAISEACNFHCSSTSDRESNLSHSPTSQNSVDDSLHISPEIKTQEKKVLIMDARSYTTAVANRARGGGCECPEYYPNCEIQFMNLANIHSIRKSFHALRQLCSSSADQPNWFSQLEGTRWLQHMSGLMKAAVTLVTAVERDARPVLVHCSDGWDRTPQIVALAELLLDPYYRTVEGFRILIEREWLAFGHKFADRCGHPIGSEDPNERCPVFLQWLDCVHQLHLQFSCAFEFSDTYLVKLVQHTYSGFFGTFLCNTQQERKAKMVYDNTISVWNFLGSSRFRNNLYAPPENIGNNKVLWPQCNVRDLHLWTEVYLGSLEANLSIETGSGACPGPPQSSSPHHMTKTRSYNDLINTNEEWLGHFRRRSDPSINIDSKLSVTAVQDIPQETFEPPQEINGHPTPNNFLDNTICNGIDIKYTNPVSTTNLTDDQIDCLGQQINTHILRVVNSKSDLPNIHMTMNGTNNENSSNNKEPVADFIKDKVNLLNGDFDKTVTEPEVDFICENVINGDKTDEHCEINERKDLTSNSNYEAEINDVICPSSIAENVLNSNINVVDDLDSETECTEKSEEKSEKTLISEVSVLHAEKSVETSTETLVADSNVCSSFKETNGFEDVHSLDEHDDIDDVHHNVSTTPIYSRASSINDGENYMYSLGEDGLIPLKSPVQERLLQIIEEQRKKEELLKKELAAYRQALLKQICHKCNYSEIDKLDDNSDSETEPSKRSLTNSQLHATRVSSPVSKLASLVESVCSAGEGPTSAVESNRSDMSWEDVAEESLYPEQPTLWVPDHTVNRCMGCHTQFWMGRRKHHCRKCGKIFCADCSENSTPLPSEQLFNPVRVCTSCYSKLRRDCGEVPDQCKHSQSPQTTNNNPQIAASSN